MNFSTTTPGNRANIPAEINNVKPAVAGTLTAKKRTLKNGRAVIPRSNPCTGMP